MEAITDTTRPLARGIEQSDFCSSVKYLSLVRVERGGSELGVWRITRRPLCPLPSPHGRALAGEPVGRRNQISIPELQGPKKGHSFGKRRSR
jgi:hypothetical protein